MGGLKWLTNLTWFAYGSRAFTRQGYDRAAARFDQSAFAPQRNRSKLVVVTGANSGLGYATSTALARAGCSVLMVCRSREKGEAALAAARRAVDGDAAAGGAGGGGVGAAGDLSLEVCDVSSLEAVEAFAGRLVASGRPLHALVNNAGVLLEARGASADGLDLSFATNTLGGLVLAARLLPALRRSPGSRVVFVSSGGMYTEALELSGWEDASKPWDGTRAYALDKRRQVAEAEELARRWGPLGVVVVSMHPGWADTEGVRSSLPGFAERLGRAMRTPQQGADTAAWLALEDAARIQPGAFYLDRAPQAKHLTLSGTHYPNSAAAELVDKLLSLAGLGGGGARGGSAAGGGAEASGAEASEGR